MTTTDLSTSSDTKLIAYGIAQELAIDPDGEITTHHFPTLNYQGDGEFVATETFVVDANLTSQEIAELINR